MIEIVTISEHWDGSKNRTWAWPSGRAQHGAALRAAAALDGGLQTRVHILLELGACSRVAAAQTAQAIGEQRGAMSHDAVSESSPCKARAGQGQQRQARGRGTRGLPGASEAREARARASLSSHVVEHVIIARNIVKFVEVELVGGEVPRERVVHVHEPTSIVWHRTQPQTKSDQARGRGLLTVNATECTRPVYTVARP